MLNKTKKIFSLFKYPIQLGTPLVSIHTVSRLVRKVAFF